MITVLVPVGPHAANRRWLSECIESVCKQTQRPGELLLLNDAGDPHGFLSSLKEYETLAVSKGVFARTWDAPWNLGVAHAFNCGVGLAMFPLVFMLGSDDTLQPECLERCLDEYHRCQDDLAYYYCGVKYMDTGEEQTAPCHAAMVTKALWRLTGGFPIASASGAPDAAFISILWNRPEVARLRPVANGEPLYNYRRHAETDTAGKAAWQGVILQTRDLVTSEWRPRA